MSFKTESSAKAEAFITQKVAPFASSYATATATASATGTNIEETTKLSHFLASDQATRIAIDIAAQNIINNSNHSLISVDVASSPSYETTTNSTATSSTSSSTAIPWVTDSTTLQDGNGNYYVIKGFSLSSTEYAASIFGTTSYYDFGYYTLTDGVYYTHYQNGTSVVSGSGNGNSSITLNTYYLMQNIILSLKQSGNGSLSSPYSAPQIRIPVNADYWLNGTAQTPSVNSYTSPYFTSGQTNVSFTGIEYQQFIVDFIYYCYTTWNASGNGAPITFTIDLHWNYASQVPLTSGSYPSTTAGSPNYGYSTASSKQLPMPGVAQYDMTNGGAGLDLTDNTITFWSSVAQTFGVNANGNAIGAPAAYTYTGGSPSSYFTKSSGATLLPVALLQNIMFELYNEPFTDELSYPNGGTAYTDNYSVYVNGGTGTYNSAGYNFTGFGQMYNTVRQTVGAENICIIGGAENFSFMNFYTTSSSGQWDSATNSINTNTYNCFTTLQQAIENGSVYSSSSSGSAGGYFAPYSFFNVLLNLHPYVGLYSGGTKHGGYYDSSYDTPIAGFAQILSALQTPGTAFSMSNPIICTEYGGYDLPWSTYSTNPSTSQSDYTYSSTYFSSAYTPQYVSSIGSAYGTPYYNGNYVNASGVSTALPGIVGFLEDFMAFNVSFCAWALRPNSGGNGQLQSTLTANSWLVADSNPYYYSWNQDTNAWAAFQPDVICGSANAYPYFQDGESATSPPSTSPSSMPNAAYSLQLISSTNQNLSTSSAETNYGANGPDFQYILDNYYNA